MKSTDMIGYLNREQCEAVLMENLLGYIGCNDGFNTYIYPVNYVYDGRFIVCHSATGSKIQVMRRNRRVCFQAGEIKSFNNWKSVLVLGEYEELDDEMDRYYAMKAFVDRMLHMKMSETAVVHDAPGHVRPVIYRIVIDEITGRYEKE